VSTTKFLPSFKQALVGAVALSASLFSSAAAMAAPITDYHLTVGYWDGTGANVNSMASDFSAAGITYDGNGLARQSHSADVSENAENLSVSLSLSTFNGESFSDHMLPSEQTAATWDGSVFDVGGIVIDWGNNGGGEWTGYDGIDTGVYNQVESAVIYWRFEDVSKNFAQDVTDSYAGLATFHSLSGTPEMYFQHGLSYGTELQNGSLMGDAKGFTIDMTLVPEPSSALLALLSLPLLSCIRRKK